MKQSRISTHKNSKPSDNAKSTPAPQALTRDQLKSVTGGGVHGRNGPPLRVSANNG